LLVKFRLLRNIQPDQLLFTNCTHKPFVNRTMLNTTLFRQVFETPYCKDFLIWNWKGIEVFDLFLCLPTTVFVIFLIIKLRSALRKLYETESLIMSTYYSFIWSVSIFNILRCLLNYFLKEPDIVYNILFLLSNFILVFLEISVVVFMSHGYMVSGREAIHRTIVITVAICLVYITIQAGFFVWNESQTLQTSGFTFLPLLVYSKFPVCHNLPCYPNSTKNFSSR